MPLCPTRCLPFLLVLTACATPSLTTSRTIPPAWLSVPETARIRTLSVDAEGKVTTSAQPAAKVTADGPVRLADDTVGPKLVNGDKILAGPFLAIDSFDYLQGRDEVAFSAKRDDDYDIGLVGAQGSEIIWVPADPADEVQVAWAPRGSKISYVIRASGGDVVRTLHAPTSFEFGIPFPNATVQALAWDPPAERYAVVYSTPDASDRVEVLKYNGEERRMAVPPASTLDVEIEPFAAGAILLRPREIRYDEKVPLVFWIADDFAWSDARAALLRNARVALVLVRRVPDEALWLAARNTPWIDAGRAFVVAPNAAPQRGVTVITTDQALEAGRYRDQGGVVSVVPADIQSFAAGFIADQLKRTTATNGSSR